MQTRKLGTQGLEVSTLGLGCMGLSFGYGPLPIKKKRLNYCIRRMNRESHSLTQQKLMNV
jgi:aryl-alcohol dehydrogenase-like predicted oxidoreductase